MNKKEYIKKLENIKNKNSITIDNLEMLLSEMKKKRTRTVTTNINGFKIESKK